MIKLDQPTIFNDTITTRLSSCDDGQMQHGWVESDGEVTANRRAFISAADLAIEHTVLVRIQYAEGATYDKILEVTESDAGMGMFKKDGLVADCLVTKTKNLGLFLPVADCGATVVYDQVNGVLALAHLGRHSTVANLASKLVDYLKTYHETDPSNVSIWISPSISPEHYVLEYADFAQKDARWANYCKVVDGGFMVDVTGYNKNQFIEAGVRESNIQASPVDTATDPNYWSHHQQKNVLGEPAPPRFAVITALT